MGNGGTDQVRKEVEMLVRALFEAGKNKDLASLADFHASPEVFTKFDSTPPYTRQTAQDAFVYEQAAFANISDYEYKLEDLRVDVIGEVALATFYLTYRGVFVNDYSFEGRMVGSKSRVTMVFARFGTSWKIVHEHFSSFPDWQTQSDSERGGRP
jgi:ketosteroid isomerase-like protein